MSTTPAGELPPAFTVNVLATLDPLPGEHRWTESVPEPGGVHITVALVFSKTQLEFAGTTRSCRPSRLRSRPAGSCCCVNDPALYGPLKCPSPAFSRYCSGTLFPLTRSRPGSTRSWI